MKVFFKLVIANFKEILRDVMLLFWFLLFPVVFALVFGFLFSNIGLGGNVANDSAIQEAIKAPKQIDYTLPGVLAITLMQLGLFGSLRIISLRAQKTLKSLGATPLPRGMFLAGEISVRLFLSLIQALIIIVIGHFIFGLTISSNWFYIFGWVLLGVSTFISIGYMLTTFAKSVDSGNALMQVIQFPMMFLSGVFIPQELMPDFLKPVINVIPLSYLVDGFRNVMTGMDSTYGMTTNFVVLSSITVISLIIAIYRFRWE